MTKQEKADVLSSIEIVDDSLALASPHVFVLDSLDNRQKLFSAGFSENEIDKSVYGEYICLLTLTVNYAPHIIFNGAKFVV